MERALKRVGTFSETQYVIVGGKDAEVPLSDRRLPLAFILQDGKLMVLRTTPVSVDTSKFNKEQVHNRMYAKLLMYCNWTDENQMLGRARRSQETCTLLHMEQRNAMDTVEEGCRQLLRQRLSSGLQAQPQALEEDENDTDTEI